MTLWDLVDGMAEDAICGDCELELLPSTRLIIWNRKDIRFMRDVFVAPDLWL